MAESDRKWTGGQLERFNDQADEDLRENNAEITENDLNLLEMTVNDIY